MTAFTELAALTTSATVSLAVVSCIAFNRAALSRAGAGCLAKDIKHDVEDSGVHVAMVVLAAHVAAFAAQMIFVANLMLSSSASICFPDIPLRHRKVAIDAVTIFIDSNKFF